MKSVATQARNYTLHTDLIEYMDDMGSNRSHLMNKAIAHAHNCTLFPDAGVGVGEALQRRIDNPSKICPTKRITVNMTMDNVRLIQRLNEITRLGTENVVSLAVEAYIWTKLEEMRENRVK